MRVQGREAGRRRHAPAPVKVECREKGRENSFDVYEDATLLRRNENTRKRQHTWRMSRLATSLPLYAHRVRYSRRSTLSFANFIPPTPNIETIIRNGDGIQKW
ncbi:hypothetical protein EVAR_6534_1 [Eumeta japonica]|uniref:Uncharacterized protein n=1 Tax=Eumeta variegata TaxID=151549 RepID=A0A4C1STF5_EUMVA|nr:hypothetical protein EVAR_6534_1 [Eumeta japonica]